MVKWLWAIAERFALVLLGLLATLLVLEGGVRALQLAPPPVPNPTIWEAHESLGWWHIPNSGGTFTSSFNEYRTEVHINALRLRDDPSLTGYDSPAGVRRILILADSYGEALEVPLEKTFFKRLQGRLAEAGLPVQTLNAGVGGWGTDQELTFYRLEGRKFHPDLTLLFFFVGNDVVNNYAPLEVARAGGAIQKNFYRLAADGSLLEPETFDRAAFRAEHHLSPPPETGRPPLADIADWLWLHSDLYRWLTPYLGEIEPVLRALGPSGLLGGQAYIAALFPGEPVALYVYRTPPDETWQAAWRLTEALLSDLRDRVAADGGRLAVVIIPTMEQVYPQVWAQTLRRRPALQAERWDLTLPNRRLADILRRNRIPYLDLLPVFREAAARPGAPLLYLPRNQHWNESGHRLAGDAVFDFVRESGLLPGE